MKNKSLIISTLFLVVIAFTTLVFNSCEKNETVLPKDNAISNTEIQLKDGALSFSSVNAFFETTGKLGAMTEKERNDWEKSLGFTSMRAELNSIFNAITETEDESVINDIVSLNSDIVKIQNEEIIPIIESQAYAAISNRSGIFFVEGVIHKVDGGRIASSEDGDVASVTNALTGSLKSSQTGVRVVDFIGSSSTLKSGGCGTEMTAYTQTSDRKCDFKMKTYKYYCTGCCGNYYYQVKSESTITNYKKNWLGKWKTYNTACEMKNRGYTISVPIVTGFNGTSSVFYYSNVTHTFSHDYSSYDCATMTRWSYVGDQVQNSNINTPSFSRVKGQASNRGVGDKWAVINCGAW